MCVYDNRTSDCCCIQPVSEVIEEIGCVVGDLNTITELIEGEHDISFNSQLFNLVDDVSPKKRGGGERGVVSTTDEIRLGGVVKEALQLSKIYETRIEESGTIIWLTSIVCWY